MHLPRRHLDLLSGDQGHRVDRLSGLCVQQAPTRHVGHPGAAEELLLHRQDAGVSIGVPGGGSKPTEGARALGLAIHVLDTDEEQLIAEAERQVLQERRVGMCAQPGLDPAIHLLAQVDAGSRPARKEGFRHLVHLNVVHTQILPATSTTVLRRHRRHGEFCHQRARPRSPSTWSESAWPGCHHGRPRIRF